MNRALLIAAIEAREDVGVDHSIADVRPPDFWLEPDTGPCPACGGTKEIDMHFGSVVIATVTCQACT